MAIKRKKRFELIYKGYSFEDAEIACGRFWEDVDAETKLEAITQVIRESYLLKGVDFDALRLLRTTAIIRKT